MAEPHFDTLRFCFQYLQLEQHPDFPAPPLLREEATQEWLYQRLFADGALDHPPPQRYQLRVLQDLLRRIEASIDDWDTHTISDNLASALPPLLTTPLPPSPTAAQQRAYTTYHLPALSPPAPPSLAPSITLLEARALLAAAGTTGLRTWDAALVLGGLLCARPHLVRGRRVLELGAGTGFLAVLCAKHLGAQHVLATDGADEVVAALGDGVFLNGLQGRGVVEAVALRWGQALVGGEDGEWNRGRGVDVVLGADVTYDPASIPALLGTLEDLFGLFPAVEIYMAVVERNQDTVEVFRAAAAKSGFALDEVPSVPPSDRQLGPFYSDAVPIHLCRLRRGA